MAEGDWLKRGTRKTFRVMKIPYLDCGGHYTTVYIGQNLEVGFLYVSCMSIKKKIKTGN